MNRHSLGSVIENEFTIQDILLIFHRRKKVVFSVTILFGLLMAVYCATCTRRYESTATVLFQKENADAMGLENVMSGETGSSDALGANIDLQTQVAILQSDTLALKTIKALNLNSSRDFLPHWSILGSIEALLTLSGAQDAQDATLDNSPRLRQSALKTFHHNLKVKAVSGTRLISIKYVNSDPVLASSVVNTLSQALVDYTFQTRYDASSQTSKWLNEQLGDLRKNSENLQARVVDLEKQSGVYGLDTTDLNGKSQAYSGVIDQLQQATIALTTAEQNKILKGAIAKAAENGNAEMLSGLAGNTLGESSSGMTNALSLIQALRQQESAAQASLDQAQAKYGPSYSRVIELRGQLLGIQKSIQDEINRVRARAQNDYQVALQTEKGTKQKYEMIKGQADKLNDKTIDYAIARQDAIESRSVYEDLMKRLEQAGVLAGLRSSNITVVDPGRIAAKPAVPNISLYMLIALSGGVFIGSCGAVVVDLLDSKVNEIDDVESAIGESAMAVLPYDANIDISNKAGKIYWAEDTHSKYAEAIRALRTSLLLSKSEQPPQVIFITSALSYEGKSVLSVNLAAALSSEDRKVLLIDADLRRHTLSRRLNFHSTEMNSLSSFLSGMTSSPVCQDISTVPYLQVLPAGPVPPNPVELLDSAKFRNYIDSQRKLYSFIVIDGTPTLPVVDAVPVSNIADVTILVTRSGVSEKDHLKRSYTELSQKGNHIVYVVLNGLSDNANSYYKYYGYGKGKRTYEYKENKDA